MSTDLETRLRAALNAEPNPAVGERLRARLPADVPPSRSRGLLALLGRVARPALAVAGAGALVAVIALLVVATPDDPPAAPPEGTGVEMVLRPIPYDPAFSAADAAARLAQIMAAQRDTRGITGMTVTVEGERVRVFVPRTHDVDWPRSLLVGLDTGVYDLGADSVVADRSLARVLEAVELPPSGPEPSRFYRVAPSQDPARSFLAGPFATADEARPVPGDGDPASARVARVAASTSIVLASDRASGGTFRFLALSQPVVAPESIAGSRADGRSLVIDIKRQAGPEAARRLVAADPDDITIISSAGGPPQALTAARFTGVDAAAGTIVFTVTGGASGLLEYVGGGGLAASVAVEEARPVGPTPARTGERPAVLPPHFRRLTTGDFAQDPFRPRMETVLRVLEARRAGEVWSLWTFLTVEGAELVTTIGPTDGAGTGGCPIAPDHPILFVCGGGSGYGGTGVGRTVNGRVGAGVASVTLTMSDGREFPATVANGFFLLLLPPGVAGEATFVVRADDGSVLARVGANAPGILPRS